MEFIGKKHSILDYYQIPLALLYNEREGKVNTNYCNKV